MTAITLKILLDNGNDITISGITTTFDVFLQQCERQKFVIFNDNPSQTQFAFNTSHIIRIEKVV